ncbi:MAG: TauD/TfdA dioxygenase family protein [Pseudomonadales bacterium]
MTTARGNQHNAASSAGIGFEIEQLSPTIGAVLHGIDLRNPLSEQQRQAVYQALLDFKVIFFRDQEINTAQHLAFARNFGELEVHPFAKHKEGLPEVLAITHDRDSKGKENAWHSDVTWRLQPSLGSVLRALEVPEVGGDTLFADMEAAYEGLSPELKSKLDGAVAIHDFAHFRRPYEKQGRMTELKMLEEKYPNPQHPVIRTHPDTGRKSIYVNTGFTKEIVGMPAEESIQLLQQLYSKASIPEYQCRFKWQPNSIAFWDNRSCQHYAASDYWPAVRRMERVTIAGDTPT